MEKKQGPVSAAERAQRGRERIEALRPYFNRCIEAADLIDAHIDALPPDTPCKLAARAATLLRGGPA